MCQLPSLLLLALEVQQISPHRILCRTVSNAFEKSRAKSRTSGLTDNMVQLCGNCGACWSKSELIGKNNL